MGVNISQRAVAISISGHFSRSNSGSQVFKTFRVTDIGVSSLQKLVMLMMQFIDKTELVRSRFAATYCSILNENGRDFSLDIPHWER
jgi:hypothetical protein